MPLVFDAEFCAVEFEELSAGLLLWQASSVNNKTIVSAHDKRVRMVSSSCARISRGAKLYKKPCKYANTAETVGRDQQRVDRDNCNTSRLVTVDARSGARS